MVPRNDEQNQQIRDQRKEQIVEAALKVFARRGFAGTKISDIASAANLSHGLVYHYFASKDDIFTGLVERALHGASTVVMYASQQPGSPWDQLNWLTEMILTHSQENSAYSFMIMLQAFTSDSVPQAVKELIQNHRSIIENLIPVIIAGQQTGQVVKDDPRRLGTVYFSFLQGLIFSKLQGATSLPKQEAEIVMRIFKG